MVHTRLTKEGTMYLESSMGVVITRAQAVKHFRAKNVIHQLRNFYAKYGKRDEYAAEVVTLFFISLGVV